MRGTVPRGELYTWMSLAVRPGRSTKAAREFSGIFKRVSNEHIREWVRKLARNLPDGDFLINLEFHMILMSWLMGLKTKIACQGSVLAGILANY
jgi:hypothetical protein